MLGFVERLFLLNYFQFLDFERHTFHEKSINHSGKHERLMQPDIHRPIDQEFLSPNELPDLFQDHPILKTSPDLDFLPGLQWLLGRGLGLLHEQGFFQN
jgi:hypothetical protein